MKKQRNEGKHPGMITRHGPATPKDVQQPVFFYAPGGQIGSPACTAFYLDFYLSKKQGQDTDKGKQSRKGLNELLADFIFKPGLKLVYPVWFVRLALLPADDPALAP